ncbi:hypothetical protein [Oceanobacillus damuensis]|uniref:hypothetical protein n=1 Tax=Oceanobacillus damuensis TaxID=937928 RepID=UPI00082CBFCD|nr:hypothetical protein [Oceanobacillus damuensis]
MARKILAYFKSENDAESARSALKTLKVTNLIVDQIPATDENPRYIPIAPIGPTWGVTGTVGLNKVGGEEASQDSDAPLTHLIEGQIEEDDLNDAIGILMKNNAFELEK